MKCSVCNKEHPPEPVTWSEGNPWQQPRPYHCPRCPEANADNKQEGWWKTDSVRAAENCRTHRYHSHPLNAAASLHDWRTTQSHGEPSGLLLPAFA